MKVADVASHPSLHQPHTLIFFIATLVCLAVAVLPPLFLKRDRSWESVLLGAEPAKRLSALFLLQFPTGN
ncbi:hypothetical protein I552_6640 [Mycobacterium xenopi 3993]|nr:hypothetical protein I552_6640 [Mycobacterium xenopi 3993]